MPNDDNYKAEDDITAFHRFLIRNTVNAARNLSKLRQTRNSKYQERFKGSVDGLTQFYFFKFSKGNVEKPEILQDKSTPPDMTEETVKDCKKVYFKIMELQDDLGHTTLESLQKGRREV